MDGTALLSALVAVVLFANTWQGDFVYDDRWVLGILKDGAFIKSWPDSLRRNARKTCSNPCQGFVYYRSRNSQAQEGLNIIATQTVLAQHETLRWY